jgi:putative DNA primase/helicase
MQTYPKGLAACNLTEPLTSTICPTTATLHEIAKALKGDVNGEWINIQGPGHSSDDRSLGIKPNKNGSGGFIVNSLAGDDPVECREYVKTKLAQVGGKLPIPAKQAGVSTPDDGKKQNREFAVQIFSESVPANGTLADVYLKSRGITCPIPPTIRFHGNLRNGAGIYGPAMVALVTRGTDDNPIGILRTFLSADGNEKAWCIPNKMMLGPCRGGAVRLSEASDSVMVGEGIETSLSAMQGTGRATWAALSAPGLCTLDLPRPIRDVIILADGDEPGERAAQDAAQRWNRQGRRVRIARAPSGLDFNDLLLGRARQDGGK